MSAPNFADRLIDACRAKGGPVCVGLDPAWEDMPEVFRRESDGDAAARAGGVTKFLSAALDVVAPHVPVVKPNLGFFEALGPAGHYAWYDVVAAARGKGLLVIGDVKRGDIGNTAEGYARAHFDLAGCDAVTLHAYLGRDSLEPFVERCRKAGRGAYVLVKTSNPGSADLQDLEVGNLRVFEEVAVLLRDWAAGEGLVGKRGWSSLGAVVGATHPAEVALLRRMLPGVPFLLPGYGAQGGTAKDCAAAFDGSGDGAVVNSSRGILLAWKKGPLAVKHGEARWEKAVEEAVLEMRAALAAALRGPR
jgi:orotidine-5'-phosphate decarboxylase